LGYQPGQTIDAATTSSQADATDTVLTEQDASDVGGKFGDTGGSSGGDGAGGTSGGVDVCACVDLSETRKVDGESDGGKVQAIDAGDAVGVVGSADAAGAGGTGGAGGAGGSGGATGDGGALGSGGTTGEGIKVSPALLSFGTVDVGTTSAPATVKVANTGAATAINATITGAGFALSGTTCTGILARDATCTVTVTFAPVAVGSATGVLTIGAATVALSGFGTPSGPGSFSATDRIDLGTLLADTTAPVVVQIVPAPSVKALACLASGTDLTLASQTCPATGTVATACTYTFTFKSTVAGSKSDSVICSGDGKATQTVVTAKVVAPASIVTSPSSASFRTMISTSSTVTINVANQGGATSGPLAAAITGSTDFAIVSNECVVPLAPLSTCKIQIEFKPTSIIDTKTGTLTVTDSTAGSAPATTTLTGITLVP
jgi:hypothetical protein